jgi:hypothetical protein
MYIFLFFSAAQTVPTPKVPYSQHFIFFVTYECAQQVEVLHYNRLERLDTDKNLANLVNL